MSLLKYYERTGISIFYEGMLSIKVSAILSKIRNPDFDRSAESVQQILSDTAELILQVAAIWALTENKLKKYKHLSMSLEGFELSNYFHMAIERMAEKRRLENGITKFYLKIHQAIIDLSENKNVDVEMILFLERFFDKLSEIFLETAQTIGRLENDE